MTETTSIATRHDDTSSKQASPTTNLAHTDAQQVIVQQEMGPSVVPQSGLVSEENGEISQKEHSEAQQTKGSEEEVRAVRQHQKEQEKLEKIRKKEQDKRDRELKRELEKLERENKKQEDKQRKELERKERELKKIEEKRSRELKREQEKQEREQRKEEEKRKKLEEKTKREEDKRQKEEMIGKNQTKIGSFFKKSSSLKSIVDTKSDYEKCFLPFYVKDGFVMGPNFALSPESLLSSVSAIDAQLKLESTPDENRAWLLSQTPLRPKCTENTAVELVQLMTSKSKSNQELDERLRQIPQRFIKFYENVRPPYVGTFSNFLKLPRDNPFAFENTGINYDYDSDWDWVNEEEEEGGDVEDLEDGDDEDEDEELDDGTEDEFDGFLDRESSQLPKDGKKFLGPLIPIVKMRSQKIHMDSEDQRYFQLVSVQHLIPEEPFPINVYNSPHTAAGATKKRPLDANGQTGGQSPMSQLPSIQHSPESSNQNSPVPAKKPKSIISEPQALLKIFSEVHESTYSLGTLTEIIQKQLLDHTKAAIRDTIKEHTTRPSVKAGSSRKWLVKDSSLWESLKKQ
ncbi:LAFA_0E17458g1_1 [Lachancea sp. 'fantastica']|nr:LAFA_0E17458g1_1 [Lachancea sp. 'fantastica']